MASAINWILSFILSFMFYLCTRLIKIIKNIYFFFHFRIEVSRILLINDILLIFSQLVFNNFVFSLSNKNYIFIEVFSLVKKKKNISTFLDIGENQKMLRPIYRESAFLTKMGQGIVCSFFFSTKLDFIFCCYISFNLN